MRNFDGQPEITEMDALIAYLQMLGTLVDFSTFTPTKAGRRDMMDTYAVLREFAGSWMLLAMFLFFIGVVIRAFLPKHKRRTTRPRPAFSATNPHPRPTAKRPEP